VLELRLQPGVFSEEVTVVGTRLAGSAETLERLPGSVEVLDRRQLATSRVMSVNEALHKATGVNVRDEEGMALRPNIGIRGLNPTRSSKTLLLEDGLFVTYAPYGDNASYYHPDRRFEDRGREGIGPDRLRAGHGGRRRQLPHAGSAREAERQPAADRG
jgi:Fe(3+) dicitrate transport protein